METRTPTTQTLNFADDGKFPNSKLPVLIYRQQLKLLGQPEELASKFEQILKANDWTNSWRNGVYDFAHYHSTSHEVLTVYGGRAVLHLGGQIVGSDVEIAAGDVLVIPAGVAHQCTSSTRDFKVVGAYPEGREWDILRGRPDERPMADERIAEVPMPKTDPICGNDGPLIRFWRDAG